MCVEPSYRSVPASAGGQQRTCRCAVVLRPPLQQGSHVLRDDRSADQPAAELSKSRGTSSLRRTHPNFACRPRRQLRSPILADPKRVLVSGTTGGAQHTAASHSAGKPKRGNAPRSRGGLGCGSGRTAQNAEATKHVTINYVGGQAAFANENRYCSKRSNA